MNPALPLDCFVPDSEAHVMPDGRLYVYGSWDQRDVNTYCSDLYHVFSTDDMVNWIDHGVSYREPGVMLYAPDCMHRNGKYYLYICKAGGAEETAVSDSPCGPFTDPKPLNFADGRGIDPCVFIDDDGQAYYFFGQFTLTGAKLNADMRTLDESSVTYNIITEEEHGFHEGASIRKIGNTYYMVYTDISRGRATCLAYATADKPLGPYRKRGIIVDNTYCDPESWNDHGSIEMFNGELYVFYHRSSRSTRFNRRLCIEKLKLNDDGSIEEAEMTTQGAGNPLDAFEYTEASRACRIRCGGYFCTDDVLLERLTGCRGSHDWQGWAEYKYIDFGTGAHGVELDAAGNGKIRISQENREDCAVIELTGDGELKLYTAEHDFDGGVHVVRLFIEGDNVDIRGFKFIK